MHKEDIIKNAKFYEQFLNKRPVYLKGQNKSMPEGPFYIEEIRIYWLDIQKSRYDMHYVLSHKAEKRTVIGKESDIIEHLYEEEKRGIFNKIPKYSVNDIVIIDNGISYGLEKDVHHVVGVIKDVFNHKNTGDAFYHIIFNSGTPRKVFEYEIETKFSTGRFWRGHEICKQLLAKMYHAYPYDYISEKDFMAWVYANFEERKEVKNIGSELNRREFERIAAEPIRFNAEILKAINDVVKIDHIKFKEEINAMFGVSKFEYKKIIFSGPCTIILWKDGTKTIAKATGSDMFDPEKGVAICFMKKILGHTETNKILRKASKQYEDYLTENGIYPTLDPKDLHALEPTEYKLNFVNHIARVSDINPNSVICIDQSAIEEVKKVEEEQDDNLAIGSRCSTCEYFDRPMTKDPCCNCLSGDQYKKREEEQK